jgi:hypothetical protein
MENNFKELVKLMDQADHLMDRVDESFQKMSRGGIIDTSRGMTGLMGNLKKANSLFKKLDKLSKTGGDSYTDEEKAIVEAKARELTNRYKMYLDLIDQSNKIAKQFLKQSADTMMGAAKSAVKETFGGKGGPEAQEGQEQAGGQPGAPTDNDAK